MFILPKCEQDEKKLEDNWWHTLVAAMLVAGRCLYTGQTTVRTSYQPSIIGLTLLSKNIAGWESCGSAGMATGLSPECSIQEEENRHIKKLLFFEDNKTRRNRQFCTVKLEITQKQKTQRKSPSRIKSSIRPPNSVVTRRKT